MIPVLSLQSSQMIVLADISRSQVLNTVQCEMSARSNRCPYVLLLKSGTGRDFCGTVALGEVHPGGLRFALPVYILRFLRSRLGVF